MYKVGDVVLVNGTVENVEDYGAVVYVCGMGKAFFNKKELIPADKTYTKGLADAWELAKKIVLSEKEGGFSYKQLGEIFGVGDCRFPMNTFTAEEALAKIEAYEKEMEIKVGDVVLDDGDKGIVTRSTHNCVYILWFDGSSGTYEPSELKKTDLHIDIESLLRQIGE